MKKIIVAVDFSQGALNALSYAIDIALFMKAEIQMLWVDSNSCDNQVLGTKNEIRHDAKLEMESILEKKSEEYPQLKISYKLRKGKVYKEFASQVSLWGADLAVIGTHGISGFEEFWVGSNAFKIISYSPCPVISVRTDYSKGGNIKKIVLPIDDTFETTKKVPMATKLAKALGAEIEMLSVYYSDLPSMKRLTDKNVEETKVYLGGKSVKLSVTSCKTNNLSKSIVKFTEDIGGDLIVIMTDQDSANKDIIMGVNSQNIINRSLIPILSVKPGELVF